MIFRGSRYQILREKSLDLEVDSAVTLKVGITEKAAVAPAKAEN